MSTFVDSIEALGEGFNGEELVGKLWKLGPNESVSLKHFTFVRWHVDLVDIPYRDKLEGGVSLEYAEETEREE